MSKPHGGHINDILTDRDQILMAAWTLPNTGALSDAQRTQAMQNFSRYIVDNQLTVADVARQLGSPRQSAIIEMSKGTFRQNADAHVRKLNNWIEQHARAKASSLTDKFVSTSVAKSMLTIARLVHENKTMGLALGPTGIGKSRCAQAIHEHYVGSLYIRIMSGYHHASGVVSAIAAQIGVRKVSGARSEHTKCQSQLERVVSTLQNSDRLLILDEAQKLADPALEVLRDIHDTAGVPVLFIATKDLYDRILATATPDQGQMYSRFDIVHSLTQGKDQFEGGKPLFTVGEIRELYDHLPIRLAPDAAQYLQGVANQLGYGSLRRCRVLLRNAARRARKRSGADEGAKVTVTADDLQWVETHMRQERSEQQNAGDRRKRYFSGTAFKTA